MMRCREQGFDTLAASLGLLSLFGVMPENDASRPAVGSVSAIAPWNRDAVECSTWAAELLPDAAHAA